MPNTPSPDLPAQHKHRSWELKVISLLRIALLARDMRIAWFEAEDLRKAREIDRQRRLYGERRRVA